MLSGGRAVCCTPPQNLSLSLSLDDAEEIEQRNMLTAFATDVITAAVFTRYPALTPATDGWTCLPWSQWGVCIRCRFWPNIERTHIHHKKCMCKKPKKITVRSSQRLCVNLDGELLHTNAISLSLWPQALLVAQKERKQYEHRYPFSPHRHSSRRCKRPSCYTSWAVACEMPARPAKAIMT